MSAVILVISASLPSKAGAFAPAVLMHLSLLRRARVGRAAEKLQDAAAEMARVATVVEATSQPMARRDPLRKHMDLIYQEVSSLNTGLLVLAAARCKRAEPDLVLPSSGCHAGDGCVGVLLT